LGLSRNSKAFPELDDLTEMLRQHGFRHGTSDGQFHLYFHKDEPSRIIHIFPHPCDSVNSYFGDGCLSWDDRLQVASIIDTIASIVLSAAPETNHIAQLELSLICGS
jgi:hypothetical protein